MRITRGQILLRTSCSKNLFSRQNTIEIKAEQTEFDVILKSAGASMLGLVKSVKEATGLCLKESMDIVGKAPAIIKKKVIKVEAEILKKALEKAGRKDLD